MATALATPTPTPARTMATSVCGVSTSVRVPISSPRAASIATISGSALVVVPPATSGNRAS